VHFLIPCAETDSLVTNSCTGYKYVRTQGMCLILSVKLKVSQAVKGLIGVRGLLVAEHTVDLSSS
jgi:hypothetical protein